MRNPKRILLLAALTILCATCPSSRAEARPHLLRRAAEWKAEHRPVVRFFQHRQPVRTAAQFVRDRRPGRRVAHLCYAGSRRALHAVARVALFPIRNRHCRCHCG